VGETGLGAVEKALHLLDFFGQGQEVRSLTDISHASGLSKATCYRTLQVLNKYGLVDREGEGYRLGFRLLELAANVKMSTPAVSVGLDLMDQLRDAVDQSVQVVVLGGDEGVYAEVLPPRTPSRLYIRPGRRAPLYGGASTRLLLATYDDAEVQDILARTELQSFTSRTPSSEAEVLQHLQLLRETWCALSLGELEPYSAELAVPILGAQGRIVASLSVAGAETDYVKPDVLEPLLVALDATALGISRRLGFNAIWPTRPDMFLSFYRANIVPRYEATTSRREVAGI
jgi:DNA-binding IclR family transcriptional regulator